VVKQLIPTFGAKGRRDGSDVGRRSERLAPAATRVVPGLEQTASGFDKGKQCTLKAADYIPVCADEKRSAWRAADPRLSLEERYGSHAGYVAAVKRLRRRR